MFQRARAAACLLFTSTVPLIAVMVGAFAAGIEAPTAAKAEVGSCAAYGGLPAGDEKTSGMGLSLPVNIHGSERHQPEARFIHTVSVDGFCNLIAMEVTNAQFRQFVDVTGYVTHRGARASIRRKTRVRRRKFLTPGSVVFVQPTE